MSNRYNLYNLEPLFRKFLIAENISPVSLKNYLSDFRNFWIWIEKNKHDLSSFDFFTKELILEYKSFLANDNVPEKTINRRLSTIRKLSSFFIIQGWIKENPAKQILNTNSSKTFYVNNTKTVSKLEKGIEQFTIAYPKEAKEINDLLQIFKQTSL